MPRPAVTLAAIFALSACGGTVAPDAPPLLSGPELAARAAAAEAPRGGPAVQGELTARASGLQARAAALRRASATSASARAEEDDLIRRAARLRAE